MLNKTYSVDPDYRDAVVLGQPVKGWVIRGKDGLPYCFQIEGRGGFCVSIEQAGLQPDEGKPR